MIVQNRLRHSVACFKSAIGRTRCGEMRSHFLQTHSKSVNLLLLPRDRRFLFFYPGLLFLHLPMRFEELIEQHRIDSFVSDRLRFPFAIRGHKVWIDRGHLLGDEAKAESALGRPPFCSGSAPA